MTTVYSGSECTVKPIGRPEIYDEYFVAEFKVSKGTQLKINGKIKAIDALNQYVNG